MAAADGLIYLSMPTATVGLIVRDAWVIDGPPYARKIGLVGKDARAVWRRYHGRPGVILHWLPDQGPSSE